MKHLSAEELAIYVEALLNDSIDKVPQEIINHIAECDECASDAIGLYEIEKDGVQVAAKKPKIRFMYMASAAVAASLLVFLLINFDVFKSSEKGNPIISGNDFPKDTAEEIIDTVKEDIEDTLNKPEKPSEEQKPTEIIKRDLKPEKEILLAANFQPNSNLEGLVDRYRGTLRGEEIEVITPIELRIKENKPIVLKWNTEEDIELSIEVFDNQEVKIDDTTTTEENYKAKISTKGLYYWKLFNEDFDLIFCGKIVVE